MTQQNDLLTTLTFFLKGCYAEEHLHFNTYSSQEAWESLAQLAYNMTGKELYDKLERNQNE